MHLDSSRWFSTDPHERRLERIGDAVLFENGRWRAPQQADVAQWRQWAKRRLNHFAANNAQPSYNSRRDEQALAASLANVDAMPDAQALDKLTEIYQQQHAARLRRWEKIAAPRYRDCTLDNFKISTSDKQIAARQGQAIERIRKFAADLHRHICDGVNIVLHGTPGTGKTHLLAALLRQAIVDCGHGANWKTGAEIAKAADPRLANPHKKDYGDGPTSKYQPLTKEPPVREVHHGECYQIEAIDDPNNPGEKLAYYALEAILKEVNDAYENRRPLWCTVNAANFGEMAELLSGPVADRMRDGALVVHLDWASYRRKGDF